MCSKLFLKVSAKSCALSLGSCFQLPSLSLSEGMEGVGAELLSSSRLSFHQSREFFGKDFSFSRSFRL